MNLKDLMKNLTDEEIRIMLKDLTDIQKERQKEEEEPEHYYTFSGEWYFGCWARSKEEAERYLSEASIEDFELNFERVEMEVRE